MNLVLTIGMSRYCYILLFWGPSEPWASQSLIFKMWFVTKYKKNVLGNFSSNIIEPPFGQLPIYDGVLLSTELEPVFPKGWRSWEGRKAFAYYGNTYITKIDAS